jgi:glutamate formiminotransferase
VSAAPAGWLECVPNLSEGRDRAVIARAAAALREAGAHVLDVTADPTHHRSVYTCAAPPETLLAAVIALVERAVQDIDLRRHHGAHPRVGAVDVVPFVPLGDGGLDACIVLARRAGEAVAERCGVPVFLYEAAASTASRRRLEDIRRGGLEGLTERMRTPEWAPDFGPATPHPSAGVTVIGARPVLIAFNINLAPANLAAARRIARAVRERSGGLRAVKAIGVDLTHRGLAQVSMNLADYRVSSPLRVYERVSELAEAEGLEVVESELIGLIPAAALPPDPATALKLAGFTPDSVLEHRLARARAER